MVIRPLTTSSLYKYTFTNPSVVASGGYRPIYINRARTTFYAVTLGSASQYSKLYKSTDGGSNWSLIKDFEATLANAVVQGLLELPSGEMLIALSPLGTFPTRIYKSTGWSSNPATATWTLKFTTPNQPLSRNYTFNNTCIGTNGVILVGEAGAQTQQNAGLTKVNGGSGYTTATITAVSGGSGEDIRATIYSGQVYRIGVLNGGTGHTNGTYHFTITGDGSSADWTYTVTGGVIQGVQTSRAISLFLSTDFGETFSEIFNIFTTPTFKYGNGLHLHAACYDESWDRIWLTFGDNTGDGLLVAGSGNTQICYSDDRGSTWTFLDGEAYLIDQSVYSQYTGIRVSSNMVYALPDQLYDIGSVCWPRTGYKTLGSPIFGFNQSHGGGEIMYTPISAYSTNDSFPCFAYYVQVNSSIPVINCTGDGGKTWYEFWRETDLVTRPAISTGAITTFLGPDTNNRMLGYYNGYDSHLKGTLTTNF